MRVSLRCTAVQVGGNWVELPPDKYVYHPLGDSQKQSHCQMEAHVHYRHVSSEPGCRRYAMLIRLHRSRAHCYRGGAALHLQ